MSLNEHSHPSSFSFCQIQLQLAACPIGSRQRPKLQFRTQISRGKKKDSPFSVFFEYITVRRAAWVGTPLYWNKRSGPSVQYLYNIRLNVGPLRLCRVERVCYLLAGSRPKYSKKTSRCEFRTKKTEIYMVVCHWWVAGVMAHHSVIYV